MPPARGRSPLLVLFLVVFLDLVGFGIVIPLLPFYAESFLAGADARTVGTLVGVLLASYSLMQFLFAPVWGLLSDRFGRRPIILTSVAGSAVALTAFALADSYWSLLAARALAGVMGANIATAQAYVADVTTAEDRAKGMGVMGAAFGLGFIFGPAIGGYFGQWGFAAPAFVAAGLAVVNLVLAFAFLPESRMRGARALAAGGGVLAIARAKDAAAKPAVLGLVLVGGLSMLAFAGMEATFGLWGERTFGFDQVETGFVFAFIGIVLAAVQGGLVGPLARRFGERRLFTMGLLGMAVSLACIPFAVTLPSLLGVMGLLAAAHGLASPSLAALLSLEASEDTQGSILGLRQALASLARVAGPIAAGFAFGALGPEVPFLAGGALMAVALVLAFPVLARSSTRSTGTMTDAAP